MFSKFYCKECFEWALYSLYSVETAILSLFIECNLLTDNYRLFN